MKFSIFDHINFSAASISPAFLKEEERLKKIELSGDISRPNFA
jgi:hypothetical protein